MGTVNMNLLHEEYSRRVIRLFISSTFTDFHEERNALRNDVFPKLNDLCLANGLGFEPVDLRWGVSEQAVENEKMLQICLSELRRCREISKGPYMLVLLGNRYGTPLVPENIDRKSFELILASVARTAAKDVRSCYKLDRNPHRALYRLQPESLRPLSNEILLTYLKESAVKVESIEMAHLISSATDHEVSEAFGDTSRIDGVHCFFREIRKSSLEGLGAPWVDTDPTGAIDTDAQEKLFELKRSLHKKLEGKIKTYRTEVVEGNVDKSYINRFRKGVYKQLANAIGASLETSASPSSRQIEASQQRYFMVSRSDNFIGRKSFLKRVHSYVPI